MRPQSGTIAFMKTSDLRKVPLWCDRAAFPRARTALAQGLCAALLLVAASVPVAAQEAVIRKNLAERLPSLPKIDEVTRSPVPGWWEVRAGTDIFYTDEQGQYVFTGELLDTARRVNLTRERIDKLTAFDVPKLPLKDAITIRQGNGARKLIVFADPNCGYCKRFERDLMALKNVTIHTYLYPILGPDSTAKSRNIWCARDPAKAWRDWMVSGTQAPPAPAQCDTGALERNMELGRRHRVQGTPAVVFEDGSRAPGAIPVDEVERRLVAAAGKN
jgi:thiol:disulfide interchange protein DsbC